METASQAVADPERFTSLLTCCRSRCGCLVQDGDNHGSERRPVCGVCWQADLDADWERWWMETESARAY